MRSHVARLAWIGLGAALLAAGCGDDEPAGSGGSTASSSSGQGGGGNEGGGGPGGGGSSSGGSGGSGPSMVNCDAATGDVPALTLTEVATDLDNPLQIKAAPGNAQRLYIVEQDGLIKVLENGAVLPAPFLDLTSVTNGFIEEGLLGVAFHPDYEQNGRFFVHYSSFDEPEPNGQHPTTIMEYARSASDPLVADPSPVAVVLKHPTQALNHNGGSIEFGSDGYLYIAIGDGGDQGDPGCDAKNPANLFGKITRLDVEAAPTADGYPAAPGNPDSQKWYHIGLRNPWRVTFDACTGELYIADVGQNTWEEVNAIPAESPPLDFGWPLREGAHDHAGYDGSCPPSSATPTEPVAEYQHMGRMEAVTGGYVYRGWNIPALRGTYFYADYTTGRVWVTKVDSGVATEPVEIPALRQGLRISSFGQDGAGEIYLIDHGGGAVYRVDPQ